MMKLNKRLQKSLSYILLPVMVLFTFQSAFATNYDNQSNNDQLSSNYECQIKNYDHQHSLTINNSSLTINDNPFKYSGYYSDSESGLYYLKARYYSPELMRFINRDTYDLSNRFAYANGNPISQVDHNGHMAKWVGTLLSLIPVVGIIYEGCKHNYTKMGVNIGITVVAVGFSIWARLAYRSLIASRAAAAELDAGKAAAEEEIGTLRTQLVLKQDAIVDADTKVSVSMDKLRTRITLRILRDAQLDNADEAGLRVPDIDAIENSTKRLIKRSAERAVERKKDLEVVWEARKVKLRAVRSCWKARRALAAKEDLFRFKFIRT
jgi:RHS repeat-associated protein